MSHPVFLEGKYDTGFVEEHMDGGMGEPEEPGDERRVALMMAAIAAYSRDKERAERASSTVVGGGDAAPWTSFGRRSQMRGMLR
jgi:acetyl-CoA carboxylase biotin carboxylase subunit